MHTLPNGWGKSKDEAEEESPLFTKTHQTEEEKAKPNEAGAQCLATQESGRMAPTSKNHRT